MTVLHRKEAEAVLPQLFLIDLVNLEDPFHAARVQIFVCRLEKISDSSAWMSCFAWSAARLPIPGKPAGKPSRK